jgi:hypothetical protein
VPRGQAGSRYWTFRHRERSGAGRETAMFFALNAVGIGITEACVGLTYPLGLARNGLAHQQRGPERRHRPGHHVPLLVI